MRFILFALVAPLGCGAAVASDTRSDSEPADRSARAVDTSPGADSVDSVPRIEFAKVAGEQLYEDSTALDVPIDSEGRVDPTRLAWPAPLDLSALGTGGLGDFTALAGGWNSTLVASSADRTTTKTARGDVGVMSIFEERCVLFAHVAVDDPGFGSTAFKHGEFGDCGPVPTTWGALSRPLLAVSNEGTWLLSYRDGEEHWFRWSAPDYYDNGWQYDGPAPLSIAVSSDLTGLLLVERNGLRFAPVFPSSAGNWQKPKDRIVLAQLADLGAAQLAVLERSGDRYLGRYDNGTFLREAELPDAMNEVALRALGGSSEGQRLVVGVTSGDEPEVVAAYFDPVVGWVLARAAARPSGEVKATLAPHGAVVTWTTGGILYAISNVDFASCAGLARADWQALQPWAPAEGAEEETLGGPDVAISNGGPIVAWATAATTRVVLLEPAGAVLIAPLLPSAEVLAVASEGTTVSLVTGDADTARFSKATLPSCSR